MPVASSAGRPSPFDPPRVTVRAAVTRALEEDLTPLGDLSSALLPKDARAEGSFVSRVDGVLAGTACATETLAQVDASTSCVWSAGDGDRLSPGEVFGVVTGPLASVLTAERTALNFLGHLSGVATYTRRFVDALEAAGGGLRVWDTRKTTPGLRALEKAAVRAGGGANHRGNLSDWVMLKDNHLALVDIDEAVRRAREWYPARTVQVECDRLDQVQAAIKAGADAVLLDNMTPEQVADCVAVVRDHAGARGRTRCLVEISGGITLENVVRYVGTGADRVSSGALTNSAPVLDIGLDVAPCS